MQRDDPDTIRLLATIGALAAARGRSAEAERAYRQALAWSEKFQPQGEETLEILNNFGVLLQKEGRHAEAHAYCARALRLGEVMLPPDDPRRIKLLLSMGALEYWADEPGSAEPFFQRALSIAERTLGPRHRLVGEILASYGKVLRQLKRNSEARACERRARTISYTLDVADLRRYQ